MEKFYSAWGVNSYGVLYYGGLTTNVDTITFEEHNPIDRNYICPFSGEECRAMQYEVYAVDKYGFVHGIYDCEIHGYVAVKVRDCWLMGEIKDKSNF